MRQLTYVFVLVLLILSSAVCRADTERVEHSFNSMTQPAELEFSGSNKIATTPLLTYTCSATAVFGFVNPNIVLTLPNAGDYVTTTRVNELNRIYILCNKTTTPSNIKIYLSKNGVDFGEALSGDGVEYTSSGTIDASFPRGNYYVKIVNDVKNNDIAIRRIDYYLEHCNCFEYIP